MILAKSASGLTSPPVWFITGSSSGLGRAFAQHAINKGYNVVATARNPESIKDLHRSNTDSVFIAKLDVKVKDDVQHSVTGAINHFGRIDVLINNAGYGMAGVVEETSDELLRAQLDTNFFGAMAVTRAVLPHMRAQGSGAIVQVSSLCGSLTYPGFGAYSASKFALEGISEALAAEVAPFGIKVLILKPGAFHTSFATGKCPIAPSIAAYDANNPAALFKQYLQEVQTTQPGDPALAAIALDEALQSPSPPLRLLLGSDAAEEVPARAVAQLKEYAAWDYLARTTDFPY